MASISRSGVMVLGDQSEKEDILGAFVEDVVLGLEKPDLLVRRELLRSVLPVHRELSGQKPRR